MTDPHSDPALPGHSPIELLRLAEECARLGGTIVRDAQPRRLERVREKARNDYVTEVDTASEAAITALLRQRVPDHAIVAEEGATPATIAGVARDTEAKGRRAIAWIVDPLDGTKNFIHGYPAFAVSVAAQGPDGVLAGAVYDPTRDELFAAARGQGATLNRDPIRVTDIGPGGALVGTGFPFRHPHLVEPYLESFRRVLEAVGDVRRGGAASLDLAYVACGRLDGFWELALSPWDVAAGWLLIEEAGGRMTDDEGGRRVFERGHVVAGGPAMHASLLELLGPALAGRVEGRPAAARTRPVG